MEEDIKDDSDIKKQISITAVEEESTDVNKLKKQKNLAKEDNDNSIKKSESRKFSNSLSLDENDQVSEADMSTDLQEEREQTVSKEAEEEISTVVTEVNNNENDVIHEEGKPEDHVTEDIDNVRDEPVTVETDHNHQQEFTMNVGQKVDDNPDHLQGVSEDEEKSTNIPCSLDQALWELENEF